MDKFEQRVFDNLILEGALEFAGIDPETGEILYNFSEKVKTIMPELYDVHMKAVNEEMMHLWEKGYLEMDLLSDNPLVVLTSKAFDQEEISNLDSDKQKFLNEIKRILAI